MSTKIQEKSEARASGQEDEEEDVPAMERVERPERPEEKRKPKPPPSDDKDESDVSEEQSDALEDDDEEDDDDEEEEGMTLYSNRYAQDERCVGRRRCHRTRLALSRPLPYLLGRDVAALRVKGPPPSGVAKLPRARAALEEAREEVALDHALLLAGEVLPGG